MTRLQLLVRGLEVRAPTPVCRGGRDTQLTVLFLGQLWHASALGAVGGLHAVGHDSRAGHSRACSPTPQRLWFCGILTAGPQLSPGNSPAAQTHSCRRKLGIRVLWVFQQDCGTWDQHHMLPSLFPRWPCLRLHGSQLLESATEAREERTCLEDVRCSQTSLTRGLRSQSWRFSNSKALASPLPVLLALLGRIYLVSRPLIII